MTSVTSPVMEVAVEPDDHTPICCGQPMTKEDELFRSCPQCGGEAVWDYDDWQYDCPNSSDWHPPRGP
jgi:Zn finger protein HypA/HybF involved in hydrogenase expression